MSTFVSVGNAKQPFRRLLDAVATCVASLPQPVVVQHGHTPFVTENCRAVAFLGMDAFAEHVRRAEIVIMHAGVGSVLHAMEAGKRPILMPRRACYGEHVNDHQVEFAMALAQSGKVIVVEEPVELVGAVRALVENHASASPMPARAGTQMPRMVELIRHVLHEYESAFPRGKPAQ